MTKLVLKRTKYRGKNYWGLIFIFNIFWDGSMRTCALCWNFQTPTHSVHGAKGMCPKCPIAIYVGIGGCTKTPYMDWTRYTDSRDSRTRKNAFAEIKFLYKVRKALKAGKLDG